MPFPPVKPSNSPWWDGAPPKCTLSKDIPAGAEVLPDYGSSRMELMSHLYGTVTTKVWPQVLAYTVFALLFFILYHWDANAGCSELQIYDDYDDLRCRPTWFDEHVASLSFISRKLEHLGTFVLTFYLGNAYARFNALYWNCRACQGAFNNIAMGIGSALDPTNISEDQKQWRQTFERYLNLCHVILYMNVSPYVQNKVSMEKLRDHDCMGVRLLTDEEYTILKFTQNPKSVDMPPDGSIVLPGSAANGPMNTVLVWLCMLFDKGSNDVNVFRADISDVRMLAVCKRFQDNIRNLRGKMAKFGFEKQLPIPLAYAHMMQLLVDVICLLTPFSIMYDINTLVVDKAGYIEHNRWATLPLTMFATAIQVYFYQGLLALSKVFLYPFGRKMAPDRDDPTSEHLYDRAFCVDVTTILKQTRLGTFIFFESTSCVPSVIKQKYQGLLMDGTKTEAAEQSEAG